MADPVIRVQNLKKQYKNVNALDGIDLSINSGEVVVIVGPSGSGKSTLLRSLNLLEIPTEGHIFVDGVDITARGTDVNLHRQKMGMVFQHFNLFPHMSVLGNLTIAPQKVRKQSMQECEPYARELLERHWSF